MTIEAEIIADSISPTRSRLTTFMLRYPRFIHAEFMTHRLFSRNASSSRAIPVAKQIEMVELDPAMPVYWGKNQRGMQADEQVEQEAADRAKQIWLDAKDKAVEAARAMSKAGIHKQLANRIIEPFSHISVVCTATDFENFFNLRCHPDAQPEIKELAEKMRDLYYGESSPSFAPIGCWHLPFISPTPMMVKDGGFDIECIDANIKASVARCARVSYRTHDQKTPTIEQDVKLHDMLFSSGHFSPFEHVATPLVNPNDRVGNLKGWIQYRKMLPGENQTSYTPPRL